MTPRSYPHGVPCWVDVESADLAAAQSFYGELFGWSFETVTPPGAPAYVIASLDGADVAALAHGDAGWSTYVAVEDADAAAAEATRTGGTVTLQPVDAGPGGRQVQLLDPSGAPLRLWQAKARPGAQHVNAPGGWNFSDLHADSPPLDFYEHLFGWDVKDFGGFSMITVPGYGSYLRDSSDPDIFERQKNAPEGFADVVAGLGPAHGQPPHWHVSFSVADRDAAVATAERLGATVTSSEENQWTRTAVIRDPQGGELTLSQFAPPADF